MESQEVGDSDDRVVIARKAPDSFVGFQWTGEEPAALNDTEIAEDLGAVWEGDELVVHNMTAFTHAVEHSLDGYQYDPD
ncbi:MAG: hypothetical protein ACRDHM_09830 [Actinomycetota bacterium]